MGNELANEFTKQQSNPSHGVMTNVSVSREMEEVKGKFLWPNNFQEIHLKQRNEFLIHVKEKV